MQIQPDHIDDLGDQLRVGGELECLRPPRLHSMMSPGPQHRRGVHPQVVGEQPRRPMRDPQLGRRRGERRGQDLGPIDRPRATRTPLIVQPRDPRSGIALAPARSPSAGPPQPEPAISVFDTPSAASSMIRARCARPARIDDDRVQDSNNSRSPGRRPIGCARIPHSRAPILSNYFRRAALGPDHDSTKEWRRGGLSRRPSRRTSRRAGANGRSQRRGATVCSFSVDLESRHTRGGQHLAAKAYASRRRR